MLLCRGSLATRAVQDFTGAGSPYRKESAHYNPDIAPVQVTLVGEQVHFTPVFPDFKDGRRQLKSGVFFRLRGEFRCEDPETLGVVHESLFNGVKAVQDMVRRHLLERRNPECTAGAVR